MRSARRISFKINSNDNWFQKKFVGQNANVWISPPPAINALVTALAILELIIENYKPFLWKSTLAISFAFRCNVDRSYNQRQIDISLISLFIIDLLSNSIFIQYTCKYYNFKHVRDVNIINKLFIQETEIKQPVKYNTSTNIYFILRLWPCPHVCEYFRERRFFPPFLKKFASTRSVFESFSPVHT